METNLHKYLEFPCSFNFKVLGLARPELPERVMEVIQRHAPGNYHPVVRPSKNGNYHSVTVTINATDIKQLETLYKELAEIDIVRMVM